jgi:hypothetical protein
MGKGSAVSNQNVRTHRDVSRRVPQRVREYSLAGAADAADSAALFLASRTAARIAVAEAGAFASEGAAETLLMGASEAGPAGVAALDPTLLPGRQQQPAPAPRGVSSARAPPQQP